MTKDKYLTLDDFYRAEKKNIMGKAKSMFFNCGTGSLTITCPDNSKIVLNRADFPNRNMYPCYRVEEGKYIIDHWEEDFSISSFNVQVVPMEVY